MSELDDMLRNNDFDYIEYYHFGDDIQKHGTTTTTVFVCGDEDVFNKDALSALCDNGKGDIKAFLAYANAHGLRTLVHKWKDFPPELCERPWEFDDDIKGRWRWRGLYYLGCDAIATNDTEILDFAIEGLCIIGCCDLQKVFERLRENINWCDQDGNTSLIFAATHGGVAMANALIAAHADLNTKNSAGQTALMCAIKNAHGNIASLLIENGADLDLREPEGKTALMYAVQCNNGCDFVKLLLNAGAKINMYDAWGKTALMYAVESKQYSIVKLLLEGGADPSLGIVGSSDREGVLPINFARSKNDNQMIEILSRSIERKCNSLRARAIPMHGHGYPNRSGSRRGQIAQVV